MTLAKELKHALAAPRMASSRSLPFGFRWVLRVCLLLLVLAQPWGFAEGKRIGVLYPEIREPYRAIFANIVAGVRDSGVGAVEEFVLLENAEGRGIDAWLESEAIDVLIALGRRGLLAAREQSSAVPVVAGAVLVGPGPETRGFKGVSLSPDPTRLLEMLRSLAPKVRRVSVVFNPDTNQWLIDRARDAAIRLRLEFKSYPAGDLRTAADRYQRIFESTDIGEDAIWLPQDPATVDERAILPLILRESWNQRMVVLSSNPSHVPRGVLFSLYPDNRAMGRTLAMLAVEPNDGAISVEPLRDLKVAVNLRTAEHLGLELSQRRRRDFDLVFPPQ
jgi:putative ABC transport system substrate-binding protein